MKTQTLSIDLLRLDGDTQARIKISEETVETYAELIDASGSVWPFGPLDVFHDGSDYFVADGFHRTLAAQRLNRASVPCLVHKGTAKDARIFGMTANDKHGLRMSQADKRACVEWLLDHGPKMTQVEVSEKAGVDVRTVKRVVAERKGPSEKGTLSPLVAKTKDKQPEPSYRDEPRAETTEALDDESSDPEIPDDSVNEPVPDDTPNVPPASAASIMLDALGKQIPKNLRAASELAIQLNATGREIDKYRQLAKTFEEQPGGEWIVVQDIDAAVRTLKGHFQGAQFHAVCPRCDGKGCKRCENTGWLPEHRKNIL